MIVYLLTNTINGKQYVGQTTRTLKDRLYQHVWGSTKHRGYILHKAIAKHGWENFTSEVLLRCLTKDELDAEEVRLIAELGTRVPNGYNWSAGGKSAGNHTPESKLKMSLQRKGRPAHANLKAAVSEANRTRVLTAETRARLSDAQKGNTKCLGRPRTTEEKKSIGDPQRGEGNHASKLTWVIVAAMREDYARGATVMTISRSYEVSHAQTSRILHNKAWVVL